MAIQSSQSYTNIADDIFSYLIGLFSQMQTGWHTSLWKVSTNLCSNDNFHHKLFSWWGNMVSMQIWFSPNKLGWWALAFFNPSMNGSDSSSALDVGGVGGTELQIPHVAMSVPIAAGIINSSIYDDHRINVFLFTCKSHSETIEMTWKLSPETTAAIEVCVAPSQSLNTT